MSAIYRFHVTKDGGNQIIDMPDLGTWKTNLYRHTASIGKQGFDITKVQIIHIMDSEEFLALTWYFEKRPYGYFATCPENSNVDEPIDVRGR